jgi:hypothetical protein
MNEEPSLLASLVLAVLALLGLLCGSAIFISFADKPPSQAEINTWAWIMGLAWGALWGAAPLAVGAVRGRLTEGLAASFVCALLGRSDRAISEVWIAHPGESGLGVYADVFLPVLGAVLFCWWIKKRAAKD